MTKGLKETKEGMDARRRQENKEVQEDAEEQEKWLEEGLMEEETKEEWNFKGENGIFYRHAKKIYLAKLNIVFSLQSMPFPILVHLKI